MNAGTHVRTYETLQAKKPEFTKALRLQQTRAGWSPAVSEDDEAPVAFLGFIGALPYMHVFFLFPV